MPASPPESTSRQHPMPFTRVEVAVMTILDSRLSVLLVKRAQAPFAGRWALPGGALRIDLDRSLDEAARRVVQERLHVQIPYLRQTTAVGGATRDPRAPWALSIVYRALVPETSIAPSAGKRVEALQWRPADEAAVDTALAFDHNELVGLAARSVRSEIDELDLPLEFCGAQFTLGELQATCEAILGDRLDKSSFRRRLAERELVEPVPGEMRTGPFRPAQLYRPAGKTRRL